MRRRRFHAKSNSPTTFSVNITSMTDMFTIMLVFLLMTYSTSDVQINPEPGLTMPESNASTNPVNAIQIHVSKNALKIGDRQIASLQNGEFGAADLENSDSSFIKPLFAELEKLPEDVQKEGKVLMVADQSLSYTTVRKVLYTASMAGFPKLKMATLLGD